MIELQQTPNLNLLEKISILTTTMSLESVLNRISEVTTTSIPEWEIIRRVESLQQILIVADVKSVVETLQSVWKTLFSKRVGYYAFKTCIIKTLLLIKEEMVDYKEFVHLIYDNIAHDDANAIKDDHEEEKEEFAHLMLLVTDLCSTVFGPRSWFRVGDQIEVCIDGSETRFPATYRGRHHIDGQCVVQYHNRRTADAMLIVEGVSNSNILGKRKNIPLGPFVEEGKLVEAYHENAWKPAVIKAYLESDYWIVKLGEKDLYSYTCILRSYQPIDDRRLCDGNKDNFRFLCSDGKCYSYSFLYNNRSESDEESETDEEPET